MSDIAVITAVYDGYDTLKPVLEQNTLMDIDWICVTDTPEVVENPQGWRVIYESRPGVHPNLAAKRPKMLPWRYTDAPCSIWMDASYRIVNPRFVPEAIAYADPIAQFIHPWRNCIYAEGEVSKHLTHKYGGHPFDAQMASYREEAGHPPNWGLWETGLIAREHNKAMRMFGVVWKQQCEFWSFQDQVSEAVVLRLMGLRPTEFPGDRTGNNWLAYEASGRH